MTQQMNCPRCQARIVDRTPAGLVAGHFLCHRCKLEFIFEVGEFSAVCLVVVSHEIEAYYPSREPWQRLADGRALIPWVEFSTRPPTA